MKAIRYGGSGFAVLLILLILTLAGYGWVTNLIKLAHMCCEVSGMLVLRVVGIFIAPLGVVLGFL